MSDIDQGGLSSDSSDFDHDGGQSPDETQAPKKGIEVPLGPPTVLVQRLSVHYRVASKENDRARMSAAQRVARRIGWSRTVTVRAVDDISFVARAGEAIGVVGHNGSGKSTLLRVMAGLETPYRWAGARHLDPVLPGGQRRPDARALRSGERPPRTAGHGVAARPR